MPNFFVSSAKNICFWCAAEFEWLVYVGRDKKKIENRWYMGLKLECLENKNPIWSLTCGEPHWQGCGEDYMR